MVLFPTCAARGHLAAPGCARGVGGYSGHRAQPAADRPTGWWPYPVRVHRPEAQAAIANLRLGTGTARDLLFAQLAGVGSRAIFLWTAASCDLRRNQAG